MEGNPIHPTENQSSSKKLLNRHEMLSNDSEYQEKTILLQDYLTRKMI